MEHLIKKNHLFTVYNNYLYKDLDLGGKNLTEINKNATVWQINK